MNPYLKFEGAPCLDNSLHGNTRWSDTGLCVTCTRNFARQAYRERCEREQVRVEPRPQKPEQIEPAARHARAAGEAIYQSRIWCMECGEHPHRITVTQHCMRCHPDEVNAEARAVVAANHAKPAT